jgi:hypothetical protein
MLLLNVQYCYLLLFNHTNCSIQPKAISKKENVSQVLFALQRHKTKNIKQIFPEEELRGLSPNYHIHVSVSVLHIPTIGQDYSAAGKYVDRSWEYINRSHTHECGKWNRGRAIPFLGIHNWDFRCCGVSLCTPILMFFGAAFRYLYFGAIWIFSCHYCIIFGIIFPSYPRREKKVTPLPFCFPAKSYILVFM